MSEPEVIGRRAEQSDTLDHAARIGLVAYGVVHLLVGWLAVQLALGDHNENASPQGALATLARQPFGKVLVWAVAIGLTLLVVWRVIEAAFGHREREGAARVRERLGSGGRAIVYAVLAFNAYKAAVGSGSSGSSGSKAASATLMDAPGGQWLVAAVGLGVIGFGIGLAWFGWKEKFAEGLDTEGKMGYSGAGYLILGKVGHIAKGIAYGLVGGLVLYAGVTHDPGKSGGLDQALQKLLQQPFGPYLLIVVAAGIAAFGLFCFAWARYLDR